MGIRAVLGYIDDFWVCAPTEEECLKAYECVLAFLSTLGFVVNRGKCVPPTTKLTFLGCELDSDAESVCRMTTPMSKRERGIVLCNEFLKHVLQSGGRCVGYSSSRYESLVGFLAHLCVRYIRRAPVLDSPLPCEEICQAIRFLLGCRISREWV
jgi:hypothetical protein